MCFFVIPAEIGFSLYLFKVEPRALTNLLKSMQGRVERTFTYASKILEQYKTRSTSYGHHWTIHSFHLSQFMTNRAWQPHFTIHICRWNFGGKVIHQSINIGYLIKLVEGKIYIGWIAATDVRIFLKKRLDKKGRS